MRIFLLAALLLVSCGKTSEKSTDESTQTGELRAKYTQKIQEAESLRNDATGWLTYSDGDSFLWDIGKYASSPLVTGVDERAAEYEGETGRHSRRPPVGQPRCWSEETGDICSPATWSRDMGTGLIAYGVRRGDLELLKDHAAYGESNNWYMGKPLADGRTLYTPAMVGLLYTAIHATGGPDSTKRHIPDVWPSGLTDYQAHIQMMKIFIRGFSDRMALLDISDVMNARVNEHYNREPYGLFYSYLHALYNGGMASVVDKCLDDSLTPPHYVRCHDNKLCALAEWIFSCSLVLQAYDEL